MKRFLSIVFIVQCIFLSACSSDGSDVSSEDFLRINGVTQDLNMRENVIISCDIANLPIYPQPGEDIKHHFVLNVTDPTEAYLPNFNSVDFTNKFHLRIIMDTDTSSGSHTTVNDISEISENTVLTEYYTDSASTSVKATPNQTVIIKKKSDDTVIILKNVRYGDNIISGRFSYTY